MKLMPGGMVDMIGKLGYSMIGKICEVNVNEH